MTDLPVKSLLRPDESEGGYSVPSCIAIQLYRLFLLQTLAKRTGSGKAYWFDNKGMRANG